MKPTQEKILSSIQENKSKKELLSVQKIDLGIIDDAVKLMDLGNSFYKEAVQTQSNAQGGWKLSAHNYDRAIKIYEKALTMAKDLGADSAIKDISKQISIASGKQKEALGYEKKLNL